MKSKWNIFHTLLLILIFVYITFIFYPITRAESVCVPDNWKELSKMNFGKDFLGLTYAKSNNKLYAAGGEVSTNNYPDEIDSSNYQKTFEEYDFSNNQWTRLDDMPRGRTNFGLFAIGNFIYAIGGNGFNASTNNFAEQLAIDAYDLNSKTWIENIAQLPVAADDIAFAAVGEKIYILGAEIRKGNSTKLATLVFDTINKSVIIKKGPEYPVGDPFVGASQDKKIYVVAGHGFGGMHSHMQVYDIEHDEWSIEDDGHGFTKRVDGSATVFKNSFFAVGGHGDDEYGILEEFNFKSKQWVSRKQSPYRAMGSAMVSANNRIYMIGGWDWDKKVKQDTLFEYTPISACTSEIE